jgi:hypothetical protein
LRPRVLIAKDLGRRSKQDHPPPEGLELAAPRPLVGVAPKHREGEAPASLWPPPARNPPSPLLATTAGRREKDRKGKGKNQRKEADLGLIDGDLWGRRLRRRLRPSEHLAAPPPPPNAPDLAQRRRCSTPKPRQVARKPTTTPTIYSGASPSPSPASRAAGEGLGSARSGGFWEQRRRSGERRAEGKKVE